VTSIPYVTTIPPVLVDRTTNQPILGPNGQPIPLLGPDGPLSLNDHVLLPVSFKLAQGIGIPAAVGGTGIPLEDGDVLSAAEASAIQARVDGFNNIIRAAAAQTGSALADINGLLRQAAGPGINVGGINFTADFLSGGLFSLDGVHPAPLGYALLANEFIRSINEAYDANIEPVDLYPFLFGEDAFLVPVSAASNFVFTEEASHQVQEVLGVGQSSGSGGPKKPEKRIDGPWKLPTKPKG